MKKDSRNLLYLAWPVMVGYPLYFAYDVWFNGLADYCNGWGGEFRRQKGGAFCEWGPSIGNWLFDAEHAYRGSSILLILVAILVATFLFWLSKTPKSSQHG